MNWKSIYRTIRTVIREFLKDSCTLRASGLAFSTLLALVPLSATVFGISTAFGAFSSTEAQIKNFLINQLLPTRQQEILSTIEVFVENANTLGIVGFMVFAVTSVSLLNGINVNFNAVWGSPIKKGILLFFTNYTSIIVFGTIFLGASFTLTNTATQIIKGVPELFWLLKIGLRIAPYLFTFLLFLIMIYVIPTGVVRKKSALVGALIGSILWEVAKYGFVKGTNYILRASIIYGSIATIPIFLFWLYLIWMIIFFSLEASYVHQHYSAEVSFLDGKMDNPAISVSLSLRIYFICAEAFLRGKSPIDTDELVLRFSLDQSTFYRAIEPLTRSSLIYEVQPHHLIFPGKDLSGVTLSSLIASLFSYDEEGATAGAVHPLVAQFIQSGSSSFNETSVLDYLNEHRDGESVR
ncbi:YihY/virulence factor BrkB family protein [Sediminispirochaeta smaragdinae]|uniref:Ribonuclease BN n=1 Tax=Sediminispirochaeta smaragdinae (strain DSM 11293 / JCM 15392 / SEBR 4228) TaxID=573413 RepID=E1R771_SEDSS|nr:YhjD/YihY/BrkB family envelope integrity protein [Sediminispirochaeta smaragdinae]ADK81398.1 ribonuclease BN [Sediminispirochaeta smaragdinae DSM 11293]